MFPWGAIIGLAGQAVSGIASAINNRKQQQATDAEAARQQAYYDAKANENPLARSENQHLLGQYDRDAQRQVETARNVATITGATPEYSLGVQKAVAEGRANLMGQMSAGASRRADYYNQLGEQARHAKAVEDQERRAARQQTYANLAANAVSAAGSIMDSYTTNGAQKAPAEPEAPAPAAAKSAPKVQTGGAVLSSPNGSAALNVAQDGTVTNPNVATPQYVKGANGEQSQVVLDSNLDWRKRANKLFSPMSIKPARYYFPTK